MQFDIVIFGASGFTGKKVVEEISRGRAKYAGVTWAVAGRSEAKLQSLLSDISAKYGVDISGIKIIIADVSDQSSLTSMCRQAKVLLNCCGPYRLYGEPVVRAALEAKTHYVDITGEEDFMGTMQIKYDNEARQAGIYVISACGFDSIPNDMGVIFLEKNFQGTLHSVESYLSLSTVKEYQKEARKSGVLNFGTWESLVYVFANFTEILKLRSKLYPKNESTYKPKLKQRYIHKQNGKWAVPLVSPDGSIVKRTQHRLLETNNKRPVQFQPYIVLPSISYVFLLGIITMFVGILSKFKYGRALLLNKPEWFSLGLVSKQGPTQAVMDNTCFTFEMFGRGWDMGQDTEASEPKKTVIAKRRSLYVGRCFLEDKSCS
ncbi:saccharopine dehydrogenase-like oxidoreductase isoform X2 [Ostrinia nubilalis]|uniref:saccharopine dehydrogenase-like oxidoreductase isoform X2 n=1 Tax=Ostrinia nubilalis TaxID=29057 RepID=UPI00308250EB